MNSGEHDGSLAGEQVVLGVSVGAGDDAVHVEHAVDVEHQQRSFVAHTNECYTAGSVAAIDVADLSLTRFAALIAPAVTRAFVAGMRAAGEDGRALVHRYGGRAVGSLIDLRNPLAAGRSISRRGLADVYRYADPGELGELITNSVDAGLLERHEPSEHGDGDSPSFRASGRGHEFLDHLFALHGRVLSERWEQPNAAFVDRLNDLVTRVLAEAAHTAGAASAVQAPPHEPDGTPPGVLLLNRLSTLRYHRADAHAAAWQAAGFSAAEMTALPWGTEWPSERVAVEDATNERAGLPYAVLTPDERLNLLADLAALP